MTIYCHWHVAPVVLSVPKLLHTRRHKLEELIEVSEDGSLSEFDWAVMLLYYVPYIYSFAGRLLRFSACTRARLARLAHIDIVLVPVLTKASQMASHLNPVAFDISKIDPPYI